MNFLPLGPKRPHVAVERAQASEMSRAGYTSCCCPVPMAGPGEGPGLLLYSTVPPSGKRGWESSDLIDL